MSEHLLINENITDKNATIDELGPLSEHHIQLAQKIVEKKHPFAKIPLSQALPFLKIFSWCCPCVDSQREDEDMLMRYANAARNSIKKLGSKDDANDGEQDKEDA